MCRKWLEDLYQELTGRCRHSVASAFYTWLYRIAVQHVKNYLTSQGRRPPSSDVLEADGLNIIMVVVKPCKLATPENLALTGEDQAYRVCRHRSRQKT